MNFRMWKKALQIIPRISKEEFAKLDFISKWLIITRAAVLVMTFTSAAIGGILAFRDGMFNAVNFIICTIGLIMAHATNNMINDFTDYIKGVDKNNYFRIQYGPHPLIEGLMNRKEFFLYLIITGVVAAGCGFYFVWLYGLPALYLMLSGAFFVLFYTFPLKYLGLGEIAVLLVWGPLMVGGTYYVVSGSLSFNAIIASLPYGIGTTTVLFGKHIDKLEMDKEKGIRTLPVILGENVSRILVVLMMTFELIFVLYLILHGYFSLTMLIVLLSLRTLILSIKEYIKPRPAERPDICPPEIWPLWFVAIAFYFNRRFGLLFLSGLLLEIILKISGIELSIYKIMPDSGF